MNVSPYTMCSQKECADRQSHKQVSVFECVDPSAPIPQRIMDPSLAVAKYRRSAAGSDRIYPVRSLDQLELVVSHLLTLLVDRRPKPDHLQQSLFDTVQFVEDRLVRLINQIRSNKNETTSHHWSCCNQRAVQVDMVLSQTTSKQLQHRIARCHLLILYLMIDCKEYQHALGHKALETALSSYWSFENGNGCETDEWDDEMLALTTLVQLDSFLQSRRPTTSTSDHDSFSFQEMYTLYRRHIPITRLPSTYPLFQWALKLTADVQLGLWHIVLRRLRKNDTGFGILARCCLAKSVPYLQFMALATYNVSFAKAEAVPVEDLVRLLQFSRDSSSLDNGDSRGTDANDSRASADDACLAFGTLLGLPVHENRCALVLKSVPIGDLPTSVRARNDRFVFRTALSEMDDNAEGIRQDLKEELRALLFLTPIPSDANLTM